jgi:hypothetical protein
MKRFLSLTLPSAAIAALALTLLPSVAAADPFPFSPTSVWNAPLAANAPLASNSSALVGELQRQVTQYGPWINTYQYSVPVYTVPAGQPTVHVTLDQNVPAVQAGFNAVPIPPNAQAAAGSDQHMVVWQPSSDTMWEFWKMNLQSNGWHARWGGTMYNVSTNPGYFPATMGATGTSLPLVGGLMTISEFQSGQINHALAVAIPQTAANSFVFPAQRSDGNYTGPNAIPEGTRFRLDPSIDVTKLGLPPAGVMIARAIQQYGMIVRDQAGSVTFYGEDPTQYGNNPWPALWGVHYPNQLFTNFPWGSLQVVSPGQ